MKKVQQRSTDDQLLTLWIASTMKKLPLFLKDLYYAN